jgi:hypothetical protein
LSAVETQDKLLGAELLLKKYAMVIHAEEQGRGKVLLVQISGLLSSVPSKK